MKVRVVWCYDPETYIASPDPNGAGLVNTSLFVFLCVIAKGTTFIIMFISVLKLVVKGVLEMKGHLDF